MATIRLFAAARAAITPATVIVISAALGLFWLSTIPLTSGLVATFFGTSCLFQYLLMRNIKRT